MPELADAVEALRKDYATSTRETHELTRMLSRRLAWQRLWLGVLALVLILAMASGWRFREQDRRRAEDQRANLIQGCERGNDQRATLREVIEEAYAPSPPLPDVPPSLSALLEESSRRSQAKRERLLSLDGVQIVDCAASYPIQ